MLPNYTENKFKTKVFFFDHNIFIYVTITTHYYYPSFLSVEVQNCTPFQTFVCVVINIIYECMETPVIRGCNFSALPLND